MQNERQLGHRSSILLFCGATLAIIMFFANWFLIPYISAVPNEHTTRYPISLFSVLFRPIYPPVDSVEHYKESLSFIFFLEGWLILIGIIGLLSIALIKLRTAYKMRWLNPLIAIYVLVLGMTEFLNDITLRFYELSSPYLGASATWYHFLLVPFVALITAGSQVDR